MIAFGATERVIGHGAILSRLLAEMAASRLAHAYLFHGPVGVGKATAARALATALFCEGNPEPCGKCPHCVKMDAGVHADFLYLGMAEGKTRIVVDQVREVARSISLTPLESKWRAALVDDAHLLNEQAANALLKTLEEPPPNTLLILVTDRPGAIMPTLRSRCRAVRFSPLADSELAAWVARQPGVTREVAVEVVKRAMGSVRRAAALLDEELLAREMRFQEEFGRVISGETTLAGLCALAEYWSDRERFVTATTLLGTWMEERIRSAVTGMGAGREVGALLEIKNLAETLVRQVHRFNVNRQLVLEALFIQIAKGRNREGGNSPFPNKGRG
ncbi:MAG: DNA polymerase III subunit delta' [Magnetococcales bacterium]|nr:DNA polymerase III subunit delta' [Magnetococcales bacterium]MBF0155978.1 DNA polymerase III subunit delta' [Magnetococcales bacterium]